MAQCVNLMPDLQMSDNVSRDTKTAEIAQMNSTLFGIKAALMFTNVGGCTASTDSTGSLYCHETAFVVTNSIVRRCESYPGSHIAVPSPYKAQTNLHRILRISAVLDAKALVDSFMGEERDFVILDTVGHVRHLFAFPRTTVAMTRWKLGGEIIGNAKELMPDSQNKFPVCHVLKVIIKHLKDTQRFHKMSSLKQAQLAQYKDFLGYGLN